MMHSSLRQSQPSRCRPSQRVPRQEMMRVTERNTPEIIIGSLALADGIEPLHRVKASLDEWSLTFLKVLVFNYIERAGWPCVINYWRASQVPTSHVAPNLFPTGDQWLAEVCDEHCR
jgi:hypothetical protein